MLRPRIIPCLLIKNKGLVKTVGFASPKYVGDPINAVKIFNEKEVDELIVLDIEASERGAGPDLRVIANIAAECRMPLCYGGGVKTPQQARDLVALGVEKVALGSAAVEDPSLIAQVAAEVGNQSVVVVMDVRRAKRGGEYEVWTHNGRVNSGRTAVDLAVEAQELGVGEIVVNSIDNDGHMKGYDVEAVRRVRNAVNVPMTALGGAGSLSDIGKLFESFGVIGASAGSLFVFKGTYRAVLINYPSQAERDQLAQTALNAR